MAQAMLDQEYCKEASLLLKKKNMGQITPLDHDLLLNVEKCKAYDRLFEQEGIEEADINRCAMVYKLTTQPRYQQLLLEMGKVIR